MRTRNLYRVRMGRKAVVEHQPRTVTVTFRLTPLEAAALDRVRGPQKRGDYLRRLLAIDTFCTPSEPTE